VRCELNIYKVSQTVNDNYDTYDSFIVVANTVDEARFTHPEDGRYWTDKGWYYKNEYTGHEVYGVSLNWCDPKDVVVDLIGTTELYKEKKVILSSFNAG
jgi:hypothetical protein